MIYLAGPYTDKSKSVMEGRFESLNKVAAALMREGHIVCSPISMNHPIAKYGLPMTWDFWEKYDIFFLKVASAIYVVKLKGWEDSVGIKGELKIARNWGIPVTYLDPKDYGVRE
jgi:hypothetical protein